MSKSELNLKMPELSLHERDRRWNVVKWKMDLAGLDCLLIWGNEAKWKTALANIRYITNNILPGIVLFPREGEPVAWSGFPHAVKSEKSSKSWIKDIRPGSMVEDLIKTMRDLGYSNADIGVVGFSSTRPQVVPDAVLYRSYARIIHELHNARFRDSSGLLDELRMIKSPEEITMLKKASQLADSMYEAMVQSAKPGVRESEVYANMLQALVANGGEEDMIWLSSGPHPPPHASKPPSSMRRLELGDILVVEYHSNYCGYISGIEHSVSIGDPQKEYKEIHEICLKSQKSGIEKMRAGNSLLEVVDAFRSPILEAGMDFVECGIHGHGLASPEFPSCMYGGMSKEWGWHPYAIIPPIVLCENMVFGTASDVFNPNWKDNSGLMLGDTVLVTAEEPIKLCRAPFELTVV